MKTTGYVSVSAFILMAGIALAQERDEELDRALNARAATLELATEYSPPPGDPDSHNAAGFAKSLCSAVFVTGLPAEFAVGHTGYFTSPLSEREKMRWRVDRDRQLVHVTLPSGETRTSKFLGDCGCVILPPGRDAPFFDPPVIESALPDPADVAWPMGDVLPENRPGDVDAQKVKQAVDLAFEPPESFTAACVVTYKGQIIGERYRDGITMHTPLESWSMGKSLTATLMGVLINEGVYSLNQSAPIPEWKGENDSRQEIQIAHLLNMSSGLRFRAPQDPDLDLSKGYPDHLYIYTGGANSFQWAATRPQQWPPGRVGRYRNSDPVLTNYLIRLGSEKLGLSYHDFPQHALFDKLGIRNMVLEKDPYGNLLLQGYEYGAARDWARLGNLYLQEGVWNGKRILPESFVKFVRTVAPGWAADGRPIYGGFFWINTDKRFPIPPDAYFMAGAGGQFTIIIPSHDLVVVRLGHDKGSPAGEDSLRRALALLMEAI